MTRRNDLATFDHQRLREIAAEAKGITAAHTPDERQAAFERFIRDDVRHFVSYVRRGVAHLAILQRNGAGRYVLHLDSTDPAFPYERFDLNEAEAEIHIAENDSARMLDALSDLDVLSRGAVLRYFRHAGESATTRDVFSVADLAERWRCSADVVRRAIRRSKLDAFRTPGGRLLRIRADAVQAYELSRRPEVATAETAARAAAQRKATDGVLSGHRARLSARSAHQRRAGKATGGEGA